MNAGRGPASRSIASIAPKTDRALLRVHLDGAARKSLSRHSYRASITQKAVFSTETSNSIRKVVVISFKLQIDRAITATRPDDRISVAQTPEFVGQVLTSHIYDTLPNSSARFSGPVSYFLILSAVFAVVVSSFRGRPWHHHQNRNPSSPSRRDVPPFVPVCWKSGRVRSHRDQFGLSDDTNQWSHSGTPYEM